MSRKIMERQARQRFVLAAARRLFAAKGVENTSLKDIAAAVDYTRRTLYSYFKGRDEICLLVLVEDLRIRWAAQQKAIAEADGGLAKLLVWARVLYQYSRDNPQTLLLQLYWDYRGLDRKRFSPEVFAAFETINDELADGLRDIFRRGIEDGSLRSDLQVDLCISQFLYSLRSVLHRALAPTYSFAQFEPDEYVQHFLDLLSRGIRNPGGTSR